MNYRMISYIMGQILKVVGLFMLLPILVGFIYGEQHVVSSFGIPFLITMAVGLIFTIKKPKNNAIFSTASRNNSTKAIRYGSVLFKTGIKTLPNSLDSIFN